MSSTFELFQKMPFQKSDSSLLFNQLNDKLDCALSNSIVQNLALPPELGKLYQLDVKRDDLIHPIVSGNKWRKLKYLLKSINSRGFQSVASMGGRYSNFMHALAYVCHLLDWRCELFIRGHAGQQPTPTMIDCQKWGAKITLVDRETFRRLRDKSPTLADDVYWISEGALQLESTGGVAEIISELEEPYDYIVIASATGTSVAGLVRGCENINSGSQVTHESKSKVNLELSLKPDSKSRDTKILGISVVNNQQQQINDINQRLGVKSNAWQLIDDYQFGGFAKKNDNLTTFCFWFEKQYKIKIEPVYTGRSFYAVFDLMNKKFFRANSKILLVHCGGLQATQT